MERPRAEGVFDPEPKLPKKRISRRSVLGAARGLTVVGLLTLIGYGGLEERDSASTPTSTASPQETPELMKYPGSEIEIRASRLSDYHPHTNQNILERLAWLHDEVVKKTEGSAIILNNDYDLTITTGIVFPGIEHSDPQKSIFGFFNNVTNVEDLTQKREALEQELEDFFGAELPEICQVINIAMANRLRADIDPKNFPLPSDTAYPINPGCWGRK